MGLRPTEPFILEKGARYADDCEVSRGQMFRSGLLITNGHNLKTSRNLWRPEGREATRQYPLAWGSPESPARQTVKAIITKQLPDRPEEGVG